MEEKQRFPFEQVAELSIYEIEDRLKVASILIKNGYTVGSGKRPKTPTGKQMDYFLKVYKSTMKE